MRMWYDSYHMNHTMWSIVAFKFSFKVLNLINQWKPYTEIDPNDIELIESIGAGSYGSGTFSIFPSGFSESGIYYQID